MIPAQARFERTAQMVVSRIVDLLDAPAAVVDWHGVALAGGIVGGAIEPAVVRLPLIVDGQRAEVLVGPARGREAPSPRLMQALVELLISQVTAGGRSARDSKDRLLYELLHGTAGDDEAVLHQASLLGLDLAPPRAVIVIDAAAFILAPDEDDSAAYDGRVRQRAQQVIDTAVSFFILPSDTICAYLGDGEVAVLKASDSRNLRSWVDGGTEREMVSSWANLHALKRASEALRSRLQADTGATISIGIGRYHPGVRGLARSYEDARAALALGTRMLGRDGVHCLDSLGIAAFVSVTDERTKTELATWLLGPLDHAPELLVTLDAYFAADGCPSAAASRLAIHRNTLSYRLDKIASLTGLDPRRLDDAMQIRLALLLRQASQNRSHQPAPAEA